jgi:2-methylisocitrate lyase-like PEP mutase family enzyme
MTTTSLKARLAADDILLAPGVYDALSALVAAQAGFEALYLSGASIAYTRLGRSDIGLTTFTEVADTLARITERVDVPLIVDADTGFGNALNTQRTVRGFERAGAAMIQLEDQTFPKRCGHLDGKGVVPVREMVGKLKAGLRRYRRCAP